MTRLNNHERFIELRKAYPFFSYEDYSIETSQNQLELSFSFNLSDQYYFYPKMVFPINDPISNNQLSDIKSLAFHIGMIELISYWKASCSPKLITKPHSLNKSQIDFWKKLYFNGLGEFFYLNGVETDIDSFMDIESSGSNLVSLDLELSNDVLVPIGGGKDSVVSIELLKNKGLRLIPYQINSNPSRNKTIENAGFDLNKSIEVKREIHPQLLELNKKGFLNGHTPFSALLAFSSLLAAYLNNTKHIALSNESSASEATIPGTKINHQYSKSYEFEEDFRNYVSNNINPEFNYFSFLRPLNELQIAKLFSKFKHHHKDFRSCNVGSKENKWCGKCPKCLFTYIILDPFVSENELKKIFGRNLLDDEGLQSTFEELSGLSAIKPFECVGSLDDVNYAVQLSIDKRNFNELPYLLEFYKKRKGLKNVDKKEIETYLKNLNIEHFLNKEFENILKPNIG